PPLKSPAPSIAQLSPMLPIAAPVAAPPFMNHMPASPALFRHRMSSRPSPLKSAKASKSQLSWLMLPRPAEPDTAPSSVNQAPSAPSSFHMTMSSKPSPLRSPRPTMSHAASMLPKPAAPETAAPFLNQEPTAPA